MRLFYLIILLILYFFLGSIFYMIIENWRFLDAFYMAIITITTVGFMEVHPLSDKGRIFTIFYLLFGMGFFYYIIYTVFGIIIEKGTFSWYKRNMENKVKKLKGHFIICGYGRLGKYTTERLQAEKIPFVIVENSPDVIEELKNRDILFIEGNAMDEETLEKANIKKAKALASLLHEDADNLYVIMTAKELNPDIFIVTKAEDKIGEKRLIKAGADRVILPYEEGGAKIAFSLLRPNLREFLELALRGSHLEYQIEELKVEKGSFLSGKTIRDSGLKKNFGMIAIGIIKKGKMLFNPDPETKIEENDILILLGEKDKFEKLSEKA